MQPDVRSMVIACTQDSDEERVHFGEIVQRLMNAGVERYHADLVRNEKVYFLPNGESVLTPCHPVDAEPAVAFSAAGVAAAVRGAQSGALRYREFCREAALAGCVGYHVSIAGKRVVYYGRTGEAHTEWFPGAK